MQLLKDRILAEGNVKDETLLNVDSFLNQQVDPTLMNEIGKEFATFFSDQGITKIVTIESSGISPALMTSLHMNVPMIILKKDPSKILNDNANETIVNSFTKQNSYTLSLLGNYITENDHVLIIDDFLADGEAVAGAARLIRKTHATIAGIGIVIEKSFQSGAKKLKELGFDVHSLVQIQSLADNIITFQ